MSKATCIYCMEGIGYERGFYQLHQSEVTIVFAHSSCHEDHIATMNQMKEIYHEIETHMEAIKGLLANTSSTFQSDVFQELVHIFEWDVVHTFFIRTIKRTFEDKKSVPA